MILVTDCATSHLQDHDPFMRNTNVKESKGDHSCLLKTFIFSSQNAMVSFKELCGLTPAANMKQCILTVSTWLMNSERSLRVTVDLSETYPTMEAQGPVPELLRKVFNAYDMVNTEAVRLQLLIDGVHMFSLLPPLFARTLHFSRSKRRVGDCPSSLVCSHRQQCDDITREALDKNNLPFFWLPNSQGS